MKSVAIQIMFAMLLRITTSFSTCNFSQNCNINRFCGHVLTIYALVRNILSSELNIPIIVPQYI